ncbi:MAG TPA: endonuclease Q family protein [Rariglobus sp.]
MTVENIARWAQRKGLDLLGTGDGLQSEWLAALEAAMEEAEPGWLKLRPEVEARVARTLPERLRRTLRHVVSAEVCCAPPGTPALGGIHHLLYFPSLEHARRFRERMGPHGDLREGRPELALNSRELLAALLEFDPRCRLAPAHVFNPWYSTLGTVSGGRTLAETFGDLEPHVLAVETGLTSTPAMCRRVSALDACALFSNSDAHSLENLGRECTLVDIAPGYEALMRALGGGSIAGTIKFPVERTRYYLNRCGACKQSFEGRRCPRCGHALVMGARDRLERIADRTEPVMRDAPFMQVLPLAYVLAEQMGVPRTAKPVQAWLERLLESLGNERHILTEASEEEIADATTVSLARAIVLQRMEAPRRIAEDPPAEEGQLGLGL